MAIDVNLREVNAGDLSIFFEDQRDPQAVRMAAFAPRDREAFLAHWIKIMADETVVARTILFEGKVAGNIVSWEQDGKREVGYWLGREFWSQGIATAALSRFLNIVKERPLVAHVAKYNLASLRVLEKCGFVQAGEEAEFSNLDGKPVEGIIMMLAG